MSIEIYHILMFSSGIHSKNGKVKYSPGKCAKINTVVNALFAGACDQYLYKRRLRPVIGHFVGQVQNTPFCVYK